MDDLIKQDEQLTTYESQLKESNSLSVLVERFQDERYFILFNILGKENGTVQIKATYVTNQSVYLSAIIQ